MIRLATILFLMTLATPQSPATAQNLRCAVVQGDSGVPACPDRAPARAAPAGAERHARVIGLSPRRPVMTVDAVHRPAPTLTALLVEQPGAPFAF